MYGRLLSKGRQKKKNMSMLNVALSRELGSVNTCQITPIRHSLIKIKLKGK